MQPFIEIGDADGHRAVVGGLTVLERVVRRLGKEGVTKVTVPSEPIDLGSVGVKRAPHPVAVDWVAPGTAPAPGQPTVRGDEIAGIRVTDASSRRAAEWKLFKSLPKSFQGPTDAMINQHFSLRITRLLCHTPITPNQITLGCVGLGLVACWLALQGSYVAFALAGVLMQLHNILDSCDGELARLRFQFSKLGAWLDNTCDEVIDDAFMACCGIAAGGAWTWIGILGGSTRFVAVAIQWIATVRAGNTSGSAYDFRFWFEKAEATADDTYSSRSATYYIRAIGRRDSYVLGFMILLLANLPEGVAAWGAALGAINFSLMMTHLAVRGAQAIRS